MTVSFRLGRYLVALLRHWATPAAIGFAIGSVLATLQIVEVLKAADDQFYQALTKVAHQCAVTDPAADTEAEQVRGRAPGSSDHASPIRRTEARAERTLDPAPTEKPPLGSVGNAFLPARNKAQLERGNTDGTFDYGSCISPADGADIGASTHRVRRAWSTRPKASLTPSSISMADTSTSSTLLSLSGISSDLQDVMGKAGLYKQLRDRIQGHAFNDMAAKHYDRYDCFKEKKRGLGRWAI